MKAENRAIGQESSFYTGLGLKIFGFFVLWAVLDPASAALTHRLKDPDDYMRLHQVANWLQGQSWYDLSVSRLSPGAGTIVHWSRLIDLPIALVALPLVSFLSLTEALFSASLIVPLAWFAALLAAVSAFAALMLPKQRASLALVLILCMPFILGNYTLGHVDHHGAQLAIAGFGMLSLAHIFLGTRYKLLFAVLSAFALSCGFWIGAEALPWAILFIACLGMGAAWFGKTLATPAALSGICLSLFTAMLIPVALPPVEYSSRALSWFSPAYAIFAGAAGSVLLFTALASRFNARGVRLLGFGVAAVLSSILFLALVPDARMGPFASYNSFDATTALDNIVEAKPLVHFDGRSTNLAFTNVIINFFNLLALPLLAFFACLSLSRRGSQEARAMWLVQALFLFASIALTAFWQVRVARFMQLFSLVPLAYVIGEIWDWLGRRTQGVPLLTARAGVFIVLGPLPGLFLPSLAAHVPHYAANKPTSISCLKEPLPPALNSLTHAPMTIMNISDTGPQLLFETPHRVVAGNFNVSGNKEAFAFFSTTDDTAALEVARKWKARVVLSCREAPRLYYPQGYFDRSKARIVQTAGGQLHLTNTDAAQPLIERLIRGKIPAWLKPIEISGPSDYLLYQIQYPAGKE